VSTHPFRVVITGAPCSGKTSAVRALPGLLNKRGLKCVVVPETASHLLASGAFMRRTPADFLLLQTAILRMQLLTEELVLAAAGDVDVVLYDRGALDGAAFVDEGSWRRICRRCGVSGRTLIGRYDLVMLLELPGRGLYTRGNNHVRTEEYEEAARQQERLAARWGGHRQVVHIPAARTMGQRLKMMEKAIEKCMPT
jgi:predicted ATPase